jgi:ribonuclease R
VKHRLVGERTRRSFRLGDKLWVRVMNVNLDERKVDFELTTAPVNARRSKASDLPTPARLPRRRNKQADGKVTEETLEPSRQKKARAPSTESGDGARSGGNKSGVKKAGVKRTADKGAKTFAADDSDGTKSKKKKPKPSKRQKLNAKKKTESKKAVKKKTAKKKPAKKAGKKTG